MSNDALSGTGAPARLRVVRARHALAPVLVSLAVAIGPVAAHASAQTMIEPDRVELSVRGAQSAADVGAMRRVILQAALNRRWRLMQDRPGVLTLEATAGDHSATVDVLYDAAGFQIKYRSSTALDYAAAGDRVVIHPRYNNWISSLSNEIRRQASGAVPQRRRGDGIDAAAAAPEASAASGTSL